MTSQHQPADLVQAGLVGQLLGLRPDADLVLSSAPGSMPWGPRTPQDITARVLAIAEAAVAHRPDALIVACNTATLHALPALRARLEPGTRSSARSRRSNRPPRAAGPSPSGQPRPPPKAVNYATLVQKFTNGVSVTKVPCPGLSDAVEHADEVAVAVAAAAERTPDDARAVVLGCTHYELVAERIRAAVQRPGLPPLILHGSADAVAAQALRRIGEQPAPQAPAEGTLTVILNGREASLPAAALTYDEGRLVQPVSPALGICP